MLTLDAANSVRSHFVRSLKEKESGTNGKGTKSPYSVFLFLLSGTNREWTGTNGSERGFCNGC